ncbi:FACT complex subunit [Raphidocelis subcapitata]|uniref:FACT complex subunit SSRP1 n=1 Tax=Raphidocelis subcapitata TaxID=307507 RepID=A0A2V0P7Z6_9CHLO|nr:FACT complex subunit [Raphidocelis subcapitata]|eukprot:GBF95966.1 FACT complex subunit [Raphidocelis subcapitata]
MADVAPQQAHQFGNISLSRRGGAHAGVLRVTPNGLVWRSQAGGQTVDVKKDDVTGLHWTKIGGRGCQLGVTRREGATVNFVGFRDKDYESLSEFFGSTFGSTLQQQQLAVSGGNWGNVSLRGSSLRMARDSKVVLEVPLPDVSQAQQLKDEVMLEFHVDDTAADDKEDTLVEMAFHVPPGCKDWALPAPPPPEEGAEAPPPEPASKGLLQALLAHTDAGVATSDDAVCAFDEVAVLAPRGRFEVEMHGSFLKMAGQTQDFKIRYTSIIRLFLLPKPATRHTLVVISLDPPIRKGQTFYNHLLCQFPNEEQTTVQLTMSDEFFKQRQDKGAKLPESRALSGAAAEVFVKALKSLSGARLTRAGAFRSAGDEAAVRCSYKADDGFLYPLERAFFYVHKPPMLFMHDDIESMEFQRQGGSVVTNSVRTFDLVIRLKNGTGEFQFRNINRTEWQALFEFINARKIRIENLRSAREGPMGAGAGRALDVGEDEDAGLRAARAEAGGGGLGDESDDESDEDFGAGAGSGEDDGSSGSSDGGSDDDASGSAGGSGSGSDAEVVSEEGIDAGEIFGKSAKRRRASGGEDGEGGGGGAAAAKPKKAKKPAAADDDGNDGDADGAAAAASGKAKKPRKKKDPNAPKKAMSAFMYFSGENRERVKRENEGIAFGAIAKLLGEEWKKLDAEGRAKYDEMAARDKERYAEAMRQYKGAGAADGDAAAADDGDGDGDGWASGGEGGDE